jgi:phosphoenolpyruvate-protein kinase (PTS system EI component)
MADGKMSVRGYAKSRGVAHTTILKAIGKRIIVTDSDGKVDPDQADATWGRLRRVVEIDSEKQNEESRRNATARIAAAAAKLRLAKQHYDAEQARYVDRVEALKVGVYEAEYFIAALAAAPDVHGERFIATLGAEPAIARLILDRFVEVALTEVGDLRDEALRTAESL